MNKFLVAIVLACSANAASSQTTLAIGSKASVTVYGLADLYYGNFSGKNVLNAGKVNESTNSTSFNGVATGGWATSRLGFAGSMEVNEDVSALVTIELGPLNLNDTTTNAATGNGLTRTRKSFVGLSSKQVGTFTLGRLQTPAFDWSFKYDPSSGAFSSLYAIASAAKAGINAADRVNNALQWTSPKWSGVTLKASSAFVKPSDSGTDDGVAANHKQTIYLLSGDYDNGILSVGVVVRKATNTEGVCGTAVSSTAATACTTAGAQEFKDGQRDWSVGAIYDLKVVKLIGSVQTVRLSSSDYNTRIVQLGANVPVLEQGTLVLSYVNGRGTVLKAGNEVAVKATGYTVLYRHQLNKSALVYAGYMNIANSDAANPLGSIAPISGWSNTPAVTAPNTIASKSVSGVGVGVSYSF